MDPSTSTAVVPSPLTRLPPELFDTLLSHVPPDQLQRTALSLRQVFPDYPLSSRHLYTYMVVHRPEQIKPLWRRLKEEMQKEGGGLTKHVNTFTMVRR
jgi:hypothetical protein